MTKECLVNRFDHFEIAARDLKHLVGLFETCGFVGTQKRDTTELKQILMIQGQIRLLITEGSPQSFQGRYAAKHGDGVCSIAYHSVDVRKTLSTALERGAELSEDVGIETEGQVSVKKASIKSFGDVRATFVERSGAPFDVDQIFGQGFQRTGQKAVPGMGFLSVDHLTNNVEMGEMDRWADFYKNIYGWVEARYFDIRASKTGLNSKVMQSPDGGAKIPINQATEAKSQVQEFIDMHKGAGVQHIAFATNDIRNAVKRLSEKGFKFLKTPHSYYEAVPTRLKNVSEPMDELEKLQILVDGDDKGYLLQIFTENQIGPLFFEVIQRKGHNGFGEGNFGALFEAMERDQIARGVL